MREAGFATIGQLADATDAELLRIDTIGTKSLNRIKDVVYQAIWM
nr:DNA-directed RNA polymerase subunit alpha C-terminal domain-containing protein [Bradyrhizobium sp. BR2003]